MQIPIPSFLKGNILFFSNGYLLNGTAIRTPLVMNPQGELTQWLTGNDYYNLAALHESYSPDLTKRAVVENDPDGLLQIWIKDLTYDTRQQVSHNTRAIAYDPVWSPDGTRIAYASAESGSTEVYVYDIATDVSRQLTFTTTALTYNQHPSWSPDSSKIVFKSNRDTGHFQIWMMNADGSDLHILHPSPYNDTDPVWVK